MSISVLPFQPDRAPSVCEFNARMSAGGSRLRFPESADSWLPKRPGRRLYTDHFLAIEDQETVRGGYILKHQDFWIGGKTLSIGDFALPISEGTHDRRYAMLGVTLLRDALTRQPRMYSLGMGGFEHPMPRLLKAAGWHMFPVPFFFRVVHGRSFLRNIAHFRRSAWRRFVLDALAFSGLGGLSLAAVRAIRHRATPCDPTVQFERVEEFGGWVDDLWSQCRDDYGMAAVRDLATLQILYPPGEPKFLRLRMQRGAQIIGWAVVLDSQLHNHKHFGSMRLGSIVDCIAQPADAGAVIGIATGWLENRGVDLIVSNQAHRAWCEAFDRAGFMRGPSNYLFAGAPELTELLRKSNITDDAMHWTRGDGDGPIHL